LAEAGIELEWRVVPGAQAVRDQLSARARKVLREDLDAALAARPPAAHLAHARELLGERDAELLVAALLSRLEPAPRTEPREVAARRETAQPERRAAPHREASGHMAPSDSRGMVRFFVNWGVNQGASPGRVLAAICRRGAVTGADVGSIAVHPNASTFDVRAEVVERFERLAQRRDPRDPRTLIRRDRGPNAGRRDVRPARRNQRS
jgi:ATP-dependent RNA helicase DeaD